jgi:fatty-acyl-CoA synthase
VEPAEIWRHLRHGGVTHFNAAPTVLSLIAADPAAREGPLPRPIRVGIGGAPPSPSLLEEMAVLNVEVTHLYGLTETLGPVVVCQWRPEWDDLPPGEQSRLKARQGVGNVIAERVRVLSPDGSDVANDGRSLGEISVRGNDVMLGYYNDPEATSRAVPDGWFRTGDLGVCHPDGYIELRDRLKDIIISGGENVSSVEVEQAIAAHPSVLESAVVGVPDERWGEVPVAFVTLRPEAEVTADELIQHLRRRLAGFKAPKRVIFCSLPKTSTGKVQKYVLRRRAAAES